MKGGDVIKLIAFEKSKNLLLKLYPTFQNYPKHERHCIVNEIRNNFFQLITNISLGENVKSKRKTYLQTADAHLQVLKLLFEVSYKRKYISKGLYYDISMEMTEIGKLINSYIKAA